MKAAAITGMFLYFFRCATSDFPIPRCPYGNTTCIQDAINEIISKYHKGFPAVSLASLDPMFIKEFKIKPNKGSNLNLRAKFMNSEVRGIKNARAYDVKGFGKNISERHSVSFKHPLVGLYGDYKADGQLSIIPLKSQGKGNVNLTGLHWTLSFNGKPNIKDGKTYLKMTKFTLKENHIDSCKFRFGNLFGSLGETLNEFLDESWRDLYLEINENIFSNFRVILYEIIQSVFDAGPYEDMFIDYQLENEKL